MTPMTLQRPSITTGQVRHFDTFGFLQITKLLPADYFHALNQDHLRAINSYNLRLPFNELGEAPAFVASGMSTESPSIVEFATGDDAYDIAEALLGRSVVCVHAFAYQRTNDTRWHSDNIDAQYQGLKFYLNLDAVDAENGALRLLPGSHHDFLRRKLVPRPYETLEQQFDCPVAHIPSTILSSEPGDLSAFDLRVWHAACGTKKRRRVIEITYYRVPEGPAERLGFVTQMRLHQRQAVLSGVPYYPECWLAAGGVRHRRGVQILADLELLESLPRLESQ